MGNAALTTEFISRAEELDCFRVAQEFADAARRTEGLADLERLLLQTAAELGFDYFALIHHVDHRIGAKGRTIRLENYPASWVEKFLEQKLYSWDPIHMASYGTNLAFAWSDVPDMIHLTKKHKDVLSSAMREGLGDGITVPANLPGEANGSFSFAVRAGKSLPRKHLNAVQLIGSIAFNTARELSAKAMTVSSSPSSPIHLSPRQLDCLVLAGRGKSDWEIAKILGIAEDTVTQHLDMARERYGVARRVQMIIRAVHDGKIALTDLL
ncbi:MULTISPECIES: LuxR family transcriptional regulator [Sphingobium]|uniref:LuxR family transcriptional regulator n=1 Tax=Sphingobium TaxID=165695 RepID=UPI00159C194F|nr:LuxR family transcriptional regulator [Sphingobium sp. 15-1]